VPCAGSRYQPARKESCWPDRSSVVPARRADGAVVREPGEAADLGGSRARGRAPAGASVVREDRHETAVQLRVHHPLDLEGDRQAPSREGSRRRSRSRRGTWNVPHALWSSEVLPPHAGDRRRKPRPWAKRSSSRRTGSGGKRHRSGSVGSLTSNRAPRTHRPSSPLDGRGDRGVDARVGNVAVRFPLVGVRDEHVDRRRAAAVQVEAELVERDGAADRDARASRNPAEMP
jgi:hypothetical protein